MLDSTITKRITLTLHLATLPINTRAEGVREEEEVHSGVEGEELQVAAALQQ